jgi:hypothetical protein
MEIFFKKLWVSIKTYWQLILLIAGGVVSYVMFRRQENLFTQNINNLLESHKEQIEKINVIREEERKQRAENERKLREALDTVQAQYDIAKKDLDNKKKKEIEDIVKQYGNDPVELAKQLSAVTGFSIIMPS